jgi:abortive infection bacteriophage resistance protein
MSEKIFKNLDEQIEILKNKGLTIRDEGFAKRKLLSENYFFLSGYRHLLMENYKNRQFIKGATFEELYAIFMFDRNLRNILFKHILIVENNIKSIISYQLSKKYGYKESDYLTETNFTQDPLKVRQVRDVLSKVKRQVRVNSQKHAATIHYINNYGYIPMWVLVKVLSFGLTAELFGILKEEDKKVINDCYKLDSDQISSYLSILANYRNLCAHEDILYDYRTQKMIPDDEIHKKLQIPSYEGEYLYGKNDLFSILIIFKHMLEDIQFQELFREIFFEIDYLDNVVVCAPLENILNKIGLPNNWKEIGPILPKKKCHEKN